MQPVPLAAYRCETFDNKIVGDVNITKNLNIQKLYNNIFDQLGSAFNGSVCDGFWKPDKNEITDETLETAAQMLFYIMTPLTNNHYWVKWYNKYHGWLCARPSLSIRRLLSKCFKEMTDINNLTMTFPFQLLQLL